MVNIWGISKTSNSNIIDSYAYLTCFDFISFSRLLQALQTFNTVHIFKGVQFCIKSGQLYIFKVKILSSWWNVAEKNKLYAEDRKNGLPGVQAWKSKQLCIRLKGILDPDSVVFRAPVRSSQFI